MVTTPKECSRFGGCYTSILLLNKSGQNEQDKIVDATKLYNKKYRQNAEGVLVCDPDASFEHFHCWNYLKNFDKWDAEGKSVKRSTTNKKRSAPEEVINIPGDLLKTGEGGDDPVIHMHGNKAAVREKALLKTESEKIVVLKKLIDSALKRNKLLEQQQFMQMCLMDPEHESSVLFMAEMRKKMLQSIQTSQQEEKEEEQKKKAGTPLLDEDGSPVLTDDGTSVMQV